MRSLGWSCASLVCACLALAACETRPRRQLGTFSDVGVAPPGWAGPSGAPTTSAPATTTASATGSSASAQPAGSAAKPVAQVQGGEYWAVYVVRGARQDEPAVKAAIDELKQRGFDFGTGFAWGSLGCDVGAAAALGAKDDANVLGVYFADEAAARAFATTLAKPPLAIAKIQAMCRD